MVDRGDVIERLKKVSHYFKSMLKVGYDGDSDVYTEHKESIKMAIELLKEQKGLMLALEQSNAVNGFLNAEVERLNGLLKEQETELSYRQAKTITHTATKLDDATCPSCGNVVGEKIRTGAIGQSIVQVRWNYCRFCGQKLDWEGR